MCRWRRRENNRNVVVVVGIKVMEMQRSKKGKKEVEERAGFPSLSLNMHNLRAKNQ